MHVFLKSSQHIIHSEVGRPDQTLHWSPADCLVTSCPVRQEELEMSSLRVNVNHSRHLCDPLKIRDICRAGNIRKTFLFNIYPSLCHRRGASTLPDPFLPSYGQQYYNRTTTNTWITTSRCRNKRRTDVANLYAKGFPETRAASLIDNDLSAFDDLLEYVVISIPSEFGAVTTGFNNDG